MIRDSGKVLRLKFCRFLNEYKRYPLGHDLRTIKTISRFSTDSEPNLPSSNNSIVPKGSSTIKYNQPAFGKSHQPNRTQSIPIRPLLTAMKVTTKLQTLTNVFQKLRVWFLCNNGSLIVVWHKGWRWSSGCGETQYREVTRLNSLPRLKPTKCRLWSLLLNVKSGAVYILSHWEWLIIMVAGRFSGIHCATWAGKFTLRKNAAIPSYSMLKIKQGECSKVVRSANVTRISFKKRF
jgi:hypothetical protein